MEKGQYGGINLVTEEEMTGSGLAMAEVTRHGQMAFEKAPPFTIRAETARLVMDGLEKRLDREDLTEEERQAAQALLDEFKSKMEPEA